MTQSGESDSGRLVQEHEGCDKCGISIVSQRGAGWVQISDRKTFEPLFAFKMVEGTDGSWTLDALARAYEHARPVNVARDPKTFPIELSVDDVEHMLAWAVHRTMVSEPTEGERALVERLAALRGELLFEEEADG